MAGEPRELIDALVNELDALRDSIERSEGDPTPAADEFDELLGWGDANGRGREGQSPKTIPKPT